MLKHDEHSGKAFWGLMTRRQRHDYIKDFSCCSRVSQAEESLKQGWCCIAMWPARNTANSVSTAAPGVCRHKPWLLAVGASDDLLRVFDRRTTGTTTGSRPRVTGPKVWQQQVTGPVQGYVFLHSAMPACCHYRGAVSADAVS